MGKQVGRIRMRKNQSKRSNMMRVTKILLKVMSRTKSLKRERQTKLSWIRGR